jgi:multidrug efflux pump subunit AcrB
VVVLFVTLGWRSALIVAMVLPVVSLASVATLNALAVPIHQMSVTGLIVALGLLVDAAIVMTDEVGKRLREGLTRTRGGRGVGAAADHAAGGFDHHHDPVVPAASAAARACGGFRGLHRDFRDRDAGLVLVVAVTITPAIAGRWLRMGDGAPAREGALMRGFRAVLALSMANPLRSVALSLSCR